MRAMRTRAVPVGAAIAMAALLASLILALGGLPRAGAAGELPSSEHLVLSQIPVAGTAQAVTLVRIDGGGAPDGAPWPLPTSAGGGNNAFTLQGNSDAVGALARSVDGRYVTLAGYTIPVGGAVEVHNETTPRDVARVDSLGAANTSTTLGGTFAEAKIRGAASVDGSAFWVTGNGNSGASATLGGMDYATLGSSSPTILFSKALLSSSNKALNNTRTVQIAGNTLYFGSEKGTAGIYTLGSPPPTTAPQTPTNIISWVEEEDPISELPLEHATSSGVDTLYVVKEDHAPVSGGIFKYAFNGTGWVNEGELAAGAYGPITGRVDSEGHFRLYALTEVSGEEKNSVVAITDTAAFNAAPVTTGPTTVATAPAGQAFRGIAFAPVDAALQVPGAPTAVTGTAGEGKVELSWTAPASNGGSAISEYRITPFIDNVPQTPVLTASTGTSFTVTGLTNGTEYTFTVEAINATGPGPASDPSAPISPHGIEIALAAEALEGTLGDPTNPSDSVAVEQPGVPPANLTVQAISSSNPGVAAASGVAVSGSGASRTVTVAPAGAVGFADIVLQVNGEAGKTATVTLHYAASAAAPDPATSRYYTGAADASTAQDVGDGYVILGDDENNTLRLYRRGVSGGPVKTWDFTAQMGNPEEIDIESSARVGNTIYWLGSMGNSKKGNLKPDRAILFSTQVSGSGAATELSFGGYYRGLREDLIHWDEANGNHFGFAAGAANGQIAKEINGFNAEGLEFAPGSSSTAYIGFRAPLVPATAGGKALVVPVTNLSSLASGGQNTTVHASFGEPILMDLGGLSVREIRKNASDEYLIVAGSYKAGGEFALYSWDGKPADAPVKSQTVLPGETGSGEDPGSWESVVAVPHPLAAGSELELVMDNGSTDYYGNGVEAKELPFAAWQKSRGDVFHFVPVSSPGSGSQPPTSPPAVQHKKHKKRHHKKRHQHRKKKHGKRHRGKACKRHARHGKHRKQKCGGRGPKKHAHGRHSIH